MGARTGEAFLEGLRAQPREVYIEGELVLGDIAQHPAFRNVHAQPRASSTTCSTSRACATT